MAGADYYSCNICGSKTFYDADLHEDCVSNYSTDTGHPWPDGNVGDMAVICRKCSKTHKVVIVAR